MAVHSESHRPVLVWFRLDLRLADNPALHEAWQTGSPVVPVFVHAPQEEGRWAPGGASRWWLHHSLGALDASLRALGSRLILRQGDTLGQLRELARDTGARAVYWNRRYEPALTSRDTRIKQALKEDGLEAKSFNSALLKEPWEILNQSGRPFQVFTPYWRQVLRDLDPSHPFPQPETLATPVAWPRSDTVEDLGMLPRIPWDAAFPSHWTPGEAGATTALRHFLSSGFEGYDSLRDRPDVAGTSRLSPHLHFGEIGPRQVWHAVAALAARQGMADPRWRSSRFLTEVGWREFAHHLLHHFPHTPGEPLRPAFNGFPWEPDPARLRAWQQGRTGYPIVDAGMRQLWATGWMHNRVRMIVGSFLVKNLLQPWTAGADWFWDTLVDADLASNTLGWQWVGGCGADAAPYFRIFNPVSQGLKFDPRGDYVRQWVPELRAMPDRFLHNPWEASPSERQAAGMSGPGAYPQPVVDLAASRKRALAAFQAMKNAGNAEIA
jgi:deoxyribodipyrimidine photo-lyase